MTTGRGVLTLLNINTKYNVLFQYLLLHHCVAVNSIENRNDEIKPIIKQFPAGAFTSVYTFYPHIGLLN